MRITDELRQYVERLDHLFDNLGMVCRMLLGIADRIDAEHERVMAESIIDMTDERMAEHGWVRLPKDADGEYIHAGDKLYGYGKTIEVVELRYGRSGWVLISRDGNGYDDTYAFTRYHKPTVEDVLEELLREYDRDDSELTNGEIIERFAAKLRLAGGDE